MIKFILLSSLVFLYVQSSIAQIDYKGFPEWSWHKQDSTEFYLYTPKKINKDSLYPIALFLHGCCGDSYRATLRNTVDPPARMWHKFGANTQTIPTYIIAPATKSGWQQHFENIKNVIDSLIKFAHGDPKRIYITGFSMGGEGTWQFIQKYPGLFAAAIPMGMNFSGDHNKVKDIPTWTLRGENDYWADSLQHHVWQIRKLNGVITDSSDSNITGVNPRYTSFKNVGHNVQWKAVSSFDLTAWAYSKINDGNLNPIVHFETPAAGSSLQKGRRVDVKIFALDPDGSISKIEILANGKRMTTLTKEPFTTSFNVPPGNVKLEAIAFDGAGKSSTATTHVMTDIEPVVTTNKLKSARQGEWFKQKIAATGNDPITFRLKDNLSLPPGLQLYTNGEVYGIPTKSGNYSFGIIAKDADGDSTVKSFSLNIASKKKGEPVLTNIFQHGKPLTVVKLAIGTHVHADNDDDELTVSNPSDYNDYTLIQTNNKDTSEENDYIVFNTDELVTVYVAYETKDKLFFSSIPSWLSSWTRSTSPQIVTQYFYYDVYRKDFPKGKITLPSPHRKENSVNNNYFVLVSKIKSR